MQTAIAIIAAACALLGVSGAAYYSLCIWAGHRFQRQTPSTPLDEYSPPVSILKSLKGIDPRMYTAFRSHCVLDYPKYEVLFGVSDIHDPAVALVKHVQEEFPQAPFRVVHCPASLGSNGKVSNLAQMLPQARYEHVLINDSDILVAPDYLQPVMRCFQQPKVGMVTTLYRAVAGKSLWSKLEALGISSDFMGGVLVAREMEGGMRFALGATIATTKSVIAQIGELESLADYLGDDYELGARAAAAKYHVELADVVVETALPDYSFADFWVHQIRWARNVKDRRPAQYAGLIATFGLVFAIAGSVIAPRAWWTWVSLAVAAVARFTAAIVIGRIVLQDRKLVRDLWLIPLRDFVALIVWIASFFGDTIVWRGERFRLREGKLTPLS